MRSDCLCQIVFAFCSGRMKGVFLPMIAICHPHATSSRQICSYAGQQRADNKRPNNLYCCQSRVRMLSYLICLQINGITTKRKDIGTNLICDVLVLLWKIVFYLITLLMGGTVIIFESNYDQIAYINRGCYPTNFRLNCSGSFTGQYLHKVKSGLREEKLQFPLVTEGIRTCSAE